MMTELPELSVELKGTSGITIRAKLSANYNLGEFTLNSMPQPIFISPWMQFEPIEMQDERARMAHEIVHRAVNYESLVKEVKHLQDQLQHMHDREDRFYKQQSATFDLWREERKKAGLPEDFSDITVWPRELQSDYISRGDE